MKSKLLALKVTAQSIGMILGVYIVMQVFSYLRDNLVLGISGLESMPGTVSSFMLLYVFPPSLVLGAFLFMLALRIQRVGERLEAGQSISPEEIEHTRIRLLGISRAVMVCNLVGFAAGYILLTVLTRGIIDLFLPQRLVILVSNLAGAVVYASAQTALHNVSFSDLRERLGIQEIGDRKRERRSTTKQVIFSICLAVYVVTFIQFNVRDASEYNDISESVLAGLAVGSIAAEDAGTEFRRQLGEKMGSFINRPNVDLDSVPLPWERPDAATSREQGIFFLFLGFILAVALGVQLAVSRDIKEQISAIARRVKDVLDGGGDLRLRLNLRAMDDLGELTDLLNRLLDRFHDVARGIAKTAGQNRSSASAIDRELTRSEELAKRTRSTVQSLEATLHVQASATQGFVNELRSFRDSMAIADTATTDQKQFVAETSAAMEEMTASIRSISAMTERAGQLSSELSERGLSGGAAVRDTRAAIDEVEKASREVLGVLVSLNKIAADTNLLAMNAAIEAAHAGAHGQGFAVVADEVRNLATSAAQRTKAIKNLIAVMGAKVDIGVQRANASGDEIIRLARGIEESAEISREIAAAAKEQAVGTATVMDSITNTVKSAETVGELMSEQSRKSDEIARALEEVLGRLVSLAEATSRQSQEVRLLEDSFTNVRREVDSNLKTVDELDAAMRRFTI